MSYRNPQKWTGWRSGTNVLAEEQGTSPKERISARINVTIKHMIEFDRKEDFRHVGIPFEALYGRATEMFPEWYFVLPVFFFCVLQKRKLERRKTMGEDELLSLLREEQARDGSRVMELANRRFKMRPCRINYSKPRSARSKSRRRRRSGSSTGKETAATATATESSDEEADDDDDGDDEESEQPAAAVKTESEDQSASDREPIIPSQRRSKRQVVMIEKRQEKRAKQKAARKAARLDMVGNKKIIPIAKKNGIALLQARESQRKRVSKSRTRRATMNVVAEPAKTAPKKDAIDALHAATLANAPPPESVAKPKRKRLRAKAGSDRQKLSMYDKLARDFDEREARERQ